MPNQLNENSVSLPVRLLGIDLLRGIAAIAVVVSHAILAVTVLSPDWNNTASTNVKNAISMWMGGLGAWGSGPLWVNSHSKCTM